MILDQKSLSLKYRVELRHLQQVSLSSFSDSFFVIHINPVSTNPLLPSDSLTLSQPSLFLTLSELCLCFNPSLTQFKATDRSYTKGDFVLKTKHVIELITKLTAIVKETFKKELKVAISNTYVVVTSLSSPYSQSPPPTPRIIAHFKVDDDPCTITFQGGAAATPHSTDSRPSPVCRRRANSLQISV